MELLYRRLTNGFSEIPSGESTLESEKILDLPRCAYFYVLNTHPKFGDLTSAFSLKEGVAGAAFVTPFDSGGLAQGHISVETVGFDKSPAEFLSDWTLDADVYAEPFVDWLDTAFKSRRDYVSGTRPEKSFVPAIDLESSSEQAWIWEARVPLPLSGATEILVHRVFLSESKVGVYLEWLRSERWLSLEDVQVHLNLVQGVFRSAMIQSTTCRII